MGDADGSHSQLRQPLLPQSGPAAAAAGDGPPTALVVKVENAPDTYDDAPSLLADCKRLLQVAVPASSCGVLMYTARLILLAKVGRLGSAAQGELTLASTAYNITGLSWVVGIATGVQTFVGAAHGAVSARRASSRQPLCPSSSSSVAAAAAAAGSAAVKGDILQRGLLLTLLTCLLPIAGWLAGAPQLLGALGQESALKLPAASYMRHVCPALPLAACNYCLTFYLQGQRAVWPLVAAMSVSIAAMPLLLWRFVDVAGWGLSGAAAAVIGVQLLEALLLATVVVWHNWRLPPHRRPWAGFSRQALFTGWGPYLSVAAPSCLMVVLAWIPFDGLTLVAGWLPAPEAAVSACGILFAIHAFFFLFLDGVATSVTVRVGNALGAHEPRSARRAVGAGLLLAAAAAAAAVTPLWLAPGGTARIFTSDPAVQALVTGSLPCVIVALCADAVAVVLSGTLRGAGRQALGSAINLGAFWLAGMPAAVLLALHCRQGVLGLWRGMAGCTVLQATALCACVCLLDWTSEVERCALLVRSQTGCRPLSIAEELPAGVASSSSSSSAEEEDEQPPGLASKGVSGSSRSRAGPDAARAKDQL